MSTKSAALRLEGLYKQYGKSAAVQDVSLSIEPGSMVALLGPSGCGKTTCLRMVAGLVEPTAGAIVLDGADITRVPVHKRNVGMLFQNYALFPQLTVAENVAFGLKMRRMAKAEIAKRIAEALQMVQLHSFSDRYHSQLSGGQQQRVALARALVIEPDLLLLDEPLGALDKGLRESMQVELRLLQRKLGITTIMVTHDQDEALTMADQVIVMRDGRIEQGGTPKVIYQKPNSQFVATFLGASNLFHCQLDAAGPNILRSGPFRFTVDGAVPLTANPVICLRPESISIAAASAMNAEGPNRASATIEQVIYRGPVMHYHMKLETGQPLVAYEQVRPLHGSRAIEVGDAVVAHWEPSSNHILPG